MRQYPVHRNLALGRSFRILRQSTAVIRKAAGFGSSQVIGTAPKVLKATKRLLRGVILANVVGHNG